MRFAYLVQTEGALPEAFAELAVRADVDLYHLAFKIAVEGAIYAPSTTWTEGRNLLLKAALARGEAYDYYIFCDDDVAFERGSWRSFEADLARWRPAIGLPAHPHPHDHPEAHAVYDFDAIVNAFHRDVIADGVLLPYVETYDSVTWWLSQFFVIHLAGALYPNAVVKFPNTAIGNLQHREYPRIEAQAFAEFKRAYLSLWSDPAFAEQHYRTHFETRDDPPWPPSLKPSYRLSDETRRRLAQPSQPARGA